jgi:hypothetical protein
LLRRFADKFAFIVRELDGIGVFGMRCVIIALCLYNYRIAIHSSPNLLQGSGF